MARLRWSRNVEADEAWGFLIRTERFCYRRIWKEKAHCIKYFTTPVAAGAVPL